MAKSMILKDRTIKFFCETPDKLGGEQAQRSLEEYD